jgi:hypothetical protein
MQCDFFMWQTDMGRFKLRVFYGTPSPAATALCVL